MVIKYSMDELNAIGEMVLIRECISRMPEYQLEPQYHQVFEPNEASKTIIAAAQSTTNTLPNSISADNFLQDFAQFQQHLDRAIQYNRDSSWQQQQYHQRNNSQIFQQQSGSEQLSDSVAEFFKRAQQNFHSVPASATVDSTSRVRRLSDVEAELLGQLKDRINI